jgi:hypothetical protein
LFKEPIEVDDNFHSYLNRVAKLTLPDTYASQINNLQESPKFELRGTERFPASFPGYSIITPPANADGVNKDFYANLNDCQQRIAKNVEPDLVALVDSDSFHVTVADLVWDNSYLALSSANPEFESKLRQQIAEGFERYGSPAATAPVRWQIMGVMLRPRAIAISLVPADEESYDRVLAFRRSVYQNPGLMNLGVEQQYHFTAHITIAYFGNVQQDFDKAGFSTLLQDINFQWIDHPQMMEISQVELRKFTDMTKYERQPDWPAIKL